MRAPSNERATNPSTKRQWRRGCNGAAFRHLRMVRASFIRPSLSDFPLRTAHDIANVIDLFRQNYDRQAERNPMMYPQDVLTLRAYWKDLQRAARRPVA